MKGTTSTPAVVWEDETGYVAVSLDELGLYGFGESRREALWDLAELIGLMEANRHQRDLRRMARKERAG